MVEEIEEFAAQFELGVFAIEVPHLAERQIVIDQPAGFQRGRVAHYIAPRSIRRHYECGRIEPLGRGLVVDVRAGDLLRKLRLASINGADVFIVTRDVDGEGHAAVESKDVGEFPAGDNAVDQVVASAPGKLPGAGHRKDMSHVEAGKPPVKIAVPARRILRGRSEDVAAGKIVDLVDVFGPRIGNEVA